MATEEEIKNAIKVLANDAEWLNRAAKRARQTGNVETGEDYVPNLEWENCGEDIQISYENVVLFILREASA